MKAHSVSNRNADVVTSPEVKGAAVEGKAARVTHVGKLLQLCAISVPGAKGVIICSRHPALLEPHPASLHAIHRT